MADAAIIQTKTLTDIADAIIAKGGAAGPLTPVEMPAAIESIKTKPDVLHRSDANFYDSDGTLLFAFTKEEVAELEELPTPPERELLIFTNWNHTLDQIKMITAGGCFADVGAIYCPISNDGRTTLIQIVIPAGGARHSFGLNILGGGIIEIDPGDGSGVGYVEGPQVVGVTHDYEEGTYFIKVTPFSQDGRFYLTEHPEASAAELLQSAGYVTKVYFGLHAGSGGTGTEVDYRNIQEITLPEGFNIYLNQSSDGFLIAPMIRFLPVRHINIPVSMKNVGSSSSYETESLLGPPPGVSYDDIVGTPSCTVPPDASVYVAIPTNGQRSVLRGRSQFSISASGETAIIAPASGFYGCHNLSALSVFPTIQVSTAMFHKCQALERVITHGDLFVKYANGLFWECTNLREIPCVNVQQATLGGNTFRNCASLEKVTLAGALTRDGLCGSKIFAGCVMLRELDLTRLPTVLNGSIGSTIFDEIPAPTVITVRVNSAFLQSYKNRQWESAIDNKNVTFNFIGV